MGERKAMENKIPLVSVITPLFNSEIFIRDTLDSVIAQTYADWELILIDDCSTDRSKEVAEVYIAQDHRIRMISLRENSGAAVARNKGIEAAKGRYIAFLDSDDVWKPEKLEKQVDFMRRHGCALSHTWYECIDENGLSKGRVMAPPKMLSYSEMLKSNQIGCLTAMYDTEKLGKVYMPLIRKRQDYGLWLKILKKVDHALCLEENLALYRNRTGSISSNKVEMIKHNWNLYRKVEGLPIVGSAYYLAWNIYRKVVR